VDNTLIISGTGGGIVNAKAGDYNLLFQLSESGALARSQTIIFTIGPATTLAATVTPLTLDRAKYTLYEISFNAPESLSAGNHPDNIANVQTRIRLEFQTAQGAINLFPIDLGQDDTTSGSTIPCYGTNYLKRKDLVIKSFYSVFLAYQTNGKLRCKIYFASSASASTPAVIEAFDFASKFILVIK